jgi:hypothetical protein
MALLLLAGPSFAASPAPKPSAAGPVLDAESLEDLAASRTTMAYVRSIATAVESYKVDKGVYPDGWLETIERRLVPTYISRFPRLDAWGTPFRISTSGGMQNVRIVSAGADRVFEPLPYLDPRTRPAPRQVADPARDIVFEDGDFIQQFGMRPSSEAPDAAARTGKQKARLAPDPMPAEVAAWDRLLDAGFPPEPKPGPDTLEALRFLASEARRACLPALAEAILRRVFGPAPEARRSDAEATFGDAWILRRDESRWSETAPFILLYLEQAERLRSRDLLDREDVVAIARARLLAVDVSPRPQPAPSGDVLRRLRESSAARSAASRARAADGSSLATSETSTNPGAPAEDPARSAHGQTLATIRRVGDALADYRSDHGEYPEVGSRLAEGTIPGVYISRVPTHDAWGTEFRVSWSADRRHFRIVSAGADRRFESPGVIEAGATWGRTSLVSDPGRDIVFQDGVFLQAYRDAR